MNQQPQALTEWLMSILLLGGAICARTAVGADPGPGTQAILRQLDSPRGICAVVGDREGRQAIELARASELTVYVQLDNAGDVVAARRAADAAGLLNRRVYVEQGSRARLHLADIAAGGQLYWGPWMCGCNLSLIGIVCLGPAGEFDYSLRATEDQRLEVLAKDPAEVAPGKQTANDWPTYRGDNHRATHSARGIPLRAVEHWQYRPETPHVCSAPLAVGDLIFVGGSDGTVRALKAGDGRLRWKAFTGGEIRVPPAVAAGHALVGSADGWVYAFEAASGRPLWRIWPAGIGRPWFRTT